MKTAFHLGLVAWGLAFACSLFGADEVWSESRTIDSPVELQGRTLRIRPGVTVSFRGRGSLHVRDASLVCNRGSFEADSVLTNAFRISVGGKVELRDCVFRNIRAVNPAGQHFIRGGVLVGGANSRIVHCTFVGCSPVMMTNAHGSEIERNLAVGGDMGFSLLQCRDVRMAGNEFYGLSNAGVTLSHVKASELFMNRFTDCKTGVCHYYCEDMRLSGNAFFGGETGIVRRDCEESFVDIGSRFEGVRRSVEVRDLRAKKSKDKNKKEGK